MTGFNILSYARIHERNDHDLKFKQVAKGFMSKGFLDPEDGKDAVAGELEPSFVRLMSSFGRYTVKKELL